MRTAHPLGSRPELGEGGPGIDPERGDSHHSLQPELRRGCHPIGQRLEVGQRAAATRGVAIQAGLDQYVQGALASPALPRGADSSLQCLDQSRRIHRLHLRRPSSY